MYINGRNAVIEAIRSGESIEKVWVQYGAEGEGLEQIRREARDRGVPTTRLDRRKFHDLEKRAQLGTRSQGVIARIDPVDYVEISHLIASIWERGEIPAIALLDRITDPHNLGAIVRSAECAGIHGVVISRRESSGISDVVIKTSAGAVHSMPIARTNSMEQTVQELKGSGLQILACTEEGDDLFTGVDLSGPVAVILGSEGEGIAPQLLDLCDGTLRIPMAGSISSLNVSVAAGVIFFELGRQRQL